MSAATKYIVRYCTTECYCTDTYLQPCSPTLRTKIFKNQFDSRTQVGNSYFSKTRYVPIRFRSCTVQQDMLYVHTMFHMDISCCTVHERLKSKAQSDPTSPSYTKNQKCAKSAATIANCTTCSHF